MIHGDEGKPMSILERISDEPCDPEPFLEYAIKNYQGSLAHWRGLENVPSSRSDMPSAKDCVTHWLGSFISTLEDLQRKMHRPSREECIQQQQSEPLSSHRREAK